MPAASHTEGVWGRELVVFSDCSCVVEGADSLEVSVVSLGVWGVADWSKVRGGGERTVRPWVRRRRLWNDHSS